MAAINIADDDLSPLSGKVIVITGGSSGIGLAGAKIFSSHGAKIVVGDLNPCLFDSPAVTFQKTDVTDWKSQVALFKKAVEVHGRIDHIWANAGIAQPDTFYTDHYDEDGELLPPNLKTMDINLTGVVYTCKLGSHYLNKQNATGSIVITSSAAGYGTFFLPDYAASKHAVVGLMRALSYLTAGTNIRVNCLAPLWTATGLPGADQKTLKDKLDITVQSAESVAKSAGWLMAGNSSRTGQSIFSKRGTFTELDSKILALTNEMNDLQTEDGLTDFDKTVQVVSQLVADQTAAKKA